MKFTKTETEILKRVVRVNKLGILCGLGIHPDEEEFNSPQYRFVKRLYDKGLIVFVPWNAKDGAGWVTPETKSLFQV